MAVLMSDAMLSVPFVSKFSLNLELSDPILSKIFLFIQMEIEISKESQYNAKIQEKNSCEL
jgi:hypothetical protein